MCRTLRGRAEGAGGHKQRQRGADQALPRPRGQSQGTHAAGEAWAGSAEPRPVPARGLKTAAVLQNTGSWRNWHS